MTTGIPPRTDPYGTASTSMLSTPISLRRIFWLIEDGADQLIPFPTSSIPKAVSAATVDRLRWVNNGPTRRIYFVIRFDPKVKIPEIKDTGSRLKDTLGLPNVAFSVVSLKSGRMLICASYSKGTSTSPSPPPSDPTDSGSPRGPYGFFKPAA